MLLAPVNEAKSISNKNSNHEKLHLFESAIGSAYFRAFRTEPIRSSSKSTQDILVSFAESYKADPMAMNSNFGIKVAEEWWAVTVARKEEGYAMGKQKQYTFHNYGPNEVTIIQGKPAQPLGTSDLQTEKL